MANNLTDRELLIKQSTQLEQVIKDIERMRVEQKEASSLSVSKRDFDKLETKVDDLIEAIAENYVTKDLFDPVRRVVYGVVGLILTAVAIAIVGLVVAG